MGAIYLVRAAAKGKPGKALYVGRAISTVAQRWNQHKTAGPQGNLLERDIFKVGYDKFTVETLAVDVRLENLETLEIKFIDQYQTRQNQGGYNDNVAAPAKPTPTVAAKIKAKPGPKPGAKKKAAAKK